MKQKLIKFKKFEPLFDGYMSIAKEIVKITKCYDCFNLEESNIKNELYQKYLDYYEILLDKFDNLSKNSEYSGLITEENKLCVDKITDVLYKLKERGELTLNTFLVGYVSLIHLIQIMKNGKLYTERSFISLFSSIRSSEKGGSYLCDFNMDDIIRNMIKEDYWYVPFLSPRGTYGINTFMYLFFNGLYPIGITLNPYEVHVNTYKGDAFLTTDHDFEHSEIVKNSYLSESKGVYNYIMTHVMEKDVDEAKKLLIYMFLRIHEGLFLRSFRNFSVIEDIIIDMWGFFRSDPYINEHDWDLDEILDDKNHKIILTKFRTFFREYLNKYEDIVKIIKNEIFF